TKDPRSEGGDASVQSDLTGSNDLVVDWSSAGWLSSLSGLPYGIAYADTVGTVTLSGDTGASASASIDTAAGASAFLITSGAGASGGDGGSTGGGGAQPALADPAVPSSVVVQHSGGGGMTIVLNFDDSVLTAVDNLGESIADGIEQAAVNAATDII